MHGLKLKSKSIEIHGIILGFLLKSKNKNNQLKYDSLSPLIATNNENYALTKRRKKSTNQIRFG